MDQLDRPSARGRSVASIAIAGVIACAAALPVLVWTEPLPLGLALLLVCFAGRGGTRD